MLQRIAAVVITLAGVALALIVGFWVLVILGVIAVVAALTYFVRTRFGHTATRRSGDVIEGEFTVVDDKEHKREE